MKHRSGCMICGEDLVYSESAVSATCFYCGTKKETNAVCVAQHYVCDACHRAVAEDLIEKFCIQTDSVDPIAMATSLMRNPVINMHGPEHHFLIPAVLLAAYCNLKSLPVEERAALLSQARKRAEDIKGGFCGFQGACGAAIGTGIFVSVMTRSTPYSGMEWRLSNRITAESLLRITEYGGPRCCKRNLRIALSSARQFLAKEFGVILPVDVQPKCIFTGLNKECLRETCPFFDAGLGA